MFAKQLIKRVSIASRYTIRLSQCQIFQLQQCIKYHNSLNGRYFSASTQNDQSNATTNAENFVDEVLKLEEWQTKVMEQNTPIILDCYADWCQPCKKLTPVLENLTRQYEGKFKLVKLNIDKLPQIASGLNVKSIPALFLIYKGNMLDAMTGGDPIKLEKFIETALLVEQTANDSSVIIKVIAQAQEAIVNKQYERGLQILQESWSYEQWREQFGTQVLIGIAWCQLMIKQDLKQVKQTLSQITEIQLQNLNEKFWIDIRANIDQEIQRLEQVAAPDSAELLLIKNVQQEPKNLEYQFQLASLLIQKGRLEDAIPVLLNIISIDKNYSDKKAQTQLRDLFTKLGPSNEEVKKGRKKLASIMF